MRRAVVADTSLCVSLYIIQTPFMRRGFVLCKSPTKNLDILRTPWRRARRVAKALRPRSYHRRPRSHNRPAARVFSQVPAHRPRTRLAQQKNPVLARRSHASSLPRSLAHLLTPCSLPARSHARARCAASAPRYSPGRARTPDHSTKSRPLPAASPAGIAQLTNQHPI